MQIVPRDARDEHTEIYIFRTNSYIESKYATAFILHISLLHRMDFETHQLAMLSRPTTITVIRGLYMRKV